MSLWQIFTSEYRKQKFDGNLDLGQTMPNVRNIQDFLIDLEAMFEYYAKCDYFYV